jgi:hypothetical protein
MIAAQHFRLLIFTAVCATSTFAVQEPRLSEVEVATAAEVKVREAGYALEAFSHGAPLYVQASRTWEIHYFPKQPPDDPSRRFTLAKA